MGHLNQEENRNLINLCKKFKHIFYKENEPLTFTNAVKHKIPTTDDIPIYTKTYRYPYIHKEEVKKQIDNMLEQGIIRQSYSPWSSPVWIVPKKIDASGKQKWRLVIDYRKLNEKTISDRYPLPNITEILDKLGRCMYFTTLDLASGFHQLEMHPKDIPKTAFTVEGGHYEYIRMPFGLKNAPSTFQRVMDNVLKDLVGKICLVYLDDIIIFSTSLTQHINDIQAIFDRLSLSNFKVQLDKSEFLRKEIAFLGHIVSTDGIKPNPMKIEAIQKFPIPKTQKDIKSFLGLLGYYRKFIPNFAQLTKPMTSCLKKGKPVIISEDYTNTFNTCKTILMNDPILQYPDFSKPFILTTDASNVALGAILSQGTIGSDKPICYASRTLSVSEVNYSTIEKELLAIVWATKYFRPYLFGRKFIIITDHRPLTWLMSLKEPNSKLVRWRLKLEEFDYEIRYKKGKQNTNADALSRVKIADTVHINVNETEENDNASIATIHSAEENLNDHLPITERPLNDFQIQIVLKRSDKTAIQLLNPFRNKLRKTIERPIYSEEEVLDIFKKFVPPNKTTAIFTDDDTFRVVQTVYSKFFSNNRTFKIVRATEFLTDIQSSDEQEQLITEYHDSNNHRGINETHWHLKRTYYFPFMQKKISEIINNCNKCEILKYDRRPQKPLLQKTETPCKPLDIIHIDIYTIAHKQILTITDKFSKFAWAYTLQAKTSICVLRSFKDFIALFGVPKKVVCDQGVEFTASIFKDFCRQQQIEQHITSFQQTTSNSPVERLHSTLTEIYRIIITTKKERRVGINHNEILKETLITYNNSIHSSTKLTPYELFFGKTYKFEQTVQFNNEHEYLDKLREFQDTLYPLIKQKVDQLKEIRTTKLNKNRTEPHTKNIGEIIFRKECRRNKLTNRFSKHKTQRDNNITLLTTDNRKIHKARIKLRKKYKRMISGSPQQPANS